MRKLLSLTGLLANLRSETVTFSIHLVKYCQNVRGFGLQCKLHFELKKFDMNFDGNIAIYGNLREFKRIIYLLKHFDTS